MSDRSPVAIVGIGCRFPGGVTDPESFWRLLESGTDAIGTLPAGRFDVARFLHPEPGVPGKMVTAEGGFLQDIDRFDAAFFGLSPREARKVDPQHRLLLEVAYEALEDAGIPVSALAGRRVGVYVGVWSGEYENVMYRTPTELDFHSITGGGRYAASGRISYAFDLRGPAMTVDTGCSASLVALHLARQAIVAGEADLAIVGAANLVLQPHVNIGYSRSGMLSVGGRCRFGDAGAAGYVRSDGVAALVLKPLGAARADHDPVRGVLLGTAINADGRGSGQLATPSADAQAELLQTVYDRAGVDPATVPYVEAHGTGTRAGDPVELEALGRVLGRNRALGAPLIVGSVKSNIGHTEAAAGMAGLIKTLLALEHGRIPANLHLRTLNETIAWGDLRVQVPVVAREWPAGAPRIAGVSSFGITGTNAHVVLGAAEPLEPPAQTARRPEVIVVSGKTAGALGDGVQRIRDWVADRSGREDATLLSSLAYTTTCRRDHQPHRLAVVADSLPDLQSALDEYLSAEDSGRAIEGVVGESANPRVAFVFSGQGSQWLGMGRELLQSAPAFADCIRRCDELVQEYAGWSLLAALNGSEVAAFDRVDRVQPTLACMQIALAEQLRAWGVSPHAVVGHSMGEVAAAYCAGALALADAVRVIVARSRLLARISGAGAMALIDLPEDEVLPLLEPAQGRVSIAAINGPRSTVISGDPAFIDALLERLDDDGVFCRRVKVDVASHSTQTDPLLDPLRAELASVVPASPRAAFYSTARPGAPTDALLDAGYWVDNLRRPVRLLAAVHAMIADGIDTFVEIAPHPVLVTSLGDIAAAADASVRTFGGLRREEPELRRLLELVARLHVAGVPVDWSTLAPADARVLHLPTYPWQRERHWLDAWEDWSGADHGNAAVTARPEATGLVHEVVWQPASPSDHAAPSPGTWVLLADDLGLAGATAALIRQRGGSPVVASDTKELSAVLQRLRAHGVAVAGVVCCAAVSAQATAAADAEAMLYTSCGTTLEAIQVLLRAQLVAPTWWVTRRVQTLPARAGDRSAWPQAALWGLVRTLWQEHPELDAHLADVDGDIADCAEQLALAMGALRHEPQLAFDAGVAYCARLVEARRDVLASPPRWRADATYLITGGLGALGLVAAEEMVRAGARRFVLMNRTALPARSQWSALQGEVAARAAGVLRLEAMGASVHLATVDAADATALRAWHEQFRSEQWPEIRGVVHCAGRLDNRPLAALTWDSLLDLLRGKALAAHCLDALLPELDRTVYFSSTVPVLPQPGQANYAAANAALDALAAARTAAGQPTVSLAWGVWKGMGLVADARVGRYVETMETAGYGSLSEADARPLFQWAVGSPRAHVVLAPIDWGVAGAGLAGRPGAAFYDAMLVESVGAVGSALRNTLVETPAKQRRALLIEQLRGMVARVLDIGVGDVAPGAPLGRQGLDSLMAVEFRNRLERALELRLPASLAWNYPTLEVMANHLLERLALDQGDVVASVPSAPVVSADDSVPAPAEGLGELRAVVAELSDDDVIRQLQGGV